MEKDNIIKKNSHADNIGTQSQASMSNHQITGNTKCEIPPRGCNQQNTECGKHIQNKWPSFFTTDIAELNKKINTLHILLKERVE